MDFKNINQAQQESNNTLLNSSERSQTVLTPELNQSTFNKSFSQAGTCDSGKAIPILTQFVYPGDTYKIKSKDTIKMSAPAGNPFNSIIYDVTYFFVPFLQIDPDFKYRLGENNNYGIDTPFTDKLPTISFKNTNSFQYTENDVANYFNLPINYNYGNQACPPLLCYHFLAYAHIWNCWYRDQNVQSVIDYTSWRSKDYINAQDYRSTMKFNQSIQFGKGLAPVSKLPDRFTTSLPYRQKGSAISIINFNELILKPLTVRNAQHPENLDMFQPTFYTPSGVVQGGTNHLVTTNGKTQAYSSTGGGSYLSEQNLALKTNEQKAPFKDVGTVPFDINNLRELIATQHYLERLALAGSRYVEQLKSIWKVEIDPLEVDRPEVIGGYSQTLINNNVQQTSESSSTSPLGKIATSLYNMVIGDEVEYTAEHYGIIMAILTIRTPINYGAQGVPKEFLYSSALDLFNPMFNGLGEQPVLNMEVYLGDNITTNLATFGYNEPWYETKTNLNNANGYLSLRSKTSLFPQYLYGQKFTNKPALNSDFMEYKSDIIGTTLFTGSSGSTVEFFHQFMFYIDFTILYTSSQPLYEVPGMSRI